MIGEFVDDATLHRLTTISHLFCEIFAASYFKRHGLKFPGGSAILTIMTLPQFTALHVWRRSRYFKKLDSVFLQFSSLQSVADAQTHCIRAFFETCHSSIFTRYLSICLPFHLIEASLAVLQNVRGCQDLSVSFPGAPTEFPLVNVPRMTPNSWISTDQCPFHFSTLRMSMGLLMTQFRPWTITVLHVTNLTALDVSSLKMWSNHWQQFLRQINIPTLVKFNVSGNAPTVSIVAFLSRHIRVQQLHITPPEISQTDNVTLSPLFLLDLRDLSGPPHVLEPLLTCLSPPPELERLTIYPSPDGLTFESVNNILDHPACDQLNELSITLPVDAATSVLSFDIQQVGFKSLLGRLKILSFSNDDFEFDDDVLVS
jgi:hypothetical protein